MHYAILQKTLEHLPLEKREPLLQLSREALYRGGGRNTTTSNGSTRKTAGGCSGLGSEKPSSV